MLRELGGWGETEGGGARISNLNNTMTTAANNVPDNNSTGQRTRLMNVAKVLSVPAQRSSRKQRHDR